MTTSRTLQLLGLGAAAVAGALGGIAYNLYSKNAKKIKSSGTEKDAKKDKPFIWNDLPRDAKLSAADYLNARDIGALSLINQEEYSQRDNYPNYNRELICQRVTDNLEKIDDSKQLSEVIALMLKTNPSAIANSERFETEVLHFIRKLNPQAVPFLTPETDVSHNAMFACAQGYFVLVYKQFNRDQVVAMTQLLESYFPGVITKVSQKENNGPYGIVLDKNIFLKQVLPYIFGVKTEGLLAHENVPPVTVIDYHPPVLMLAEDGTILVNMEQVMHIVQDLDEEREQVEQQLQGEDEEESEQQAQSAHPDQAEQPEQTVPAEHADQTQDQATQLRRR